MKKAIAFLLLIMQLICLCSCVLQNDAQQQSRDDSTDTGKYWQVQTKTLYPMGVNGQVEAVSVCDGYLFAAGREQNRFSLVRMAVEAKEDEVEFGHPQLMPLPESTIDAQILGLSGNEEKLYLLLGTSQEEGSPDMTYEVWIFAVEGRFEKCVPLVFAAEDIPRSILALPDGHFCLTGDKTCVEYDDGGQALASLKSRENEFQQAMLLGERLIIQSADMQTGAAVLNLTDLTQETLTPVEGSEEFGRSVSLCQNTGGAALINNGANLLAIDENYEDSVVLDWYALTGDYGYNYSHIVQINGSTLLLIQKDTKELKCLTMQYVEDERTPLHVGLYGHAADVEEQIQRLFVERFPDYRVELVSYGNDEQGMTRLISALGTDEAPELIISEGYCVNPAVGFADLYPFIDGDGELSRESFLPFILKGLERDGKLPQIWGRFGLYAAIATGPLAYGPEPLRLADCQAYLDNRGYEEPLFDEYMTGEALLSSIANGLIFRARNGESGEYELDQESIRELIALCGSLPREYAYYDEQPPMSSQVLAWRDINLAYLNYLEKEEIPYRLFAGEGDNFTQVAAYYNSCYMIPESCEEKEKVWKVLRELLKADYQIQVCADGYSGLPVNVQAFDSVISAYLSEQAGQELRTVMEEAAFSDYESFQIKKILVENLRPYLYGDRTLDEVLANAQSQIQIFAAEHAP